MRNGLLKMALLAGVRDTWQTKSEHWVDACAQATALMFYGYDSFMKPFLTPDQYIVGALIDLKRKSDAESLASKLLASGNPSYLYLMNGKTELVSDTAEALRELGAGAMALAAWRVTEDNKLYVTMRSLHDSFDVGKTATQMGGGGHTKASGFTKVLASLSDIYRYVAILESCIAEQAQELGL